MRHARSFQEARPQYPGYQPMDIRSWRRCAIGVAATTAWCAVSAQQSTPPRAGAAAGTTTARPRAGGDVPATARDRETAERLLREVIALQQKEDAAGVQRSIPLARQALATWRALGDRGKEAAAWQALARSEYLLGQLDAAIGDFSSALDIREALHSTEGEATTRAYRASAYWAKGNVRRAIEDYTIAAGLAHAIGAPGLEAYALNGLGNAYVQSDPIRARDMYERALALWRAAADSGGEGMILNNLGVLHNALGERQQALQLFREALPLMRDAGQVRRSADALLNMGDIYNALARPDEAIAFFEQALAIERATGDKRNEAQAARHLGAAHLQRGQLGAASRDYARALSLAREVGDRAAEGDALHGRGDFLAASGRHEEAVAAFRQALEAHHETGRAGGEAADLHAIGEAFVALSRPGQALESFTRALDLRRLSEDRVGEAETLYQKARLHAAGNGLAEARSEIESAIVLAESHRTNLTTPGLRTAYFATVQTYYRWYVDLLMRLEGEQPYQNFGRLALDISERSRARGLLDRLNEAGADVMSDVDPALAERHRHIRRMLSFNANRRDSLPAGVSAERVRLEREIAALLAEYEAVHAEILDSSRRYAGLAQPRPLGDAQIQALLDAETTLVVYVVGLERVYAWVITPSAITVATLTSPQRLEQVTRPALQALAATPFQPSPSPQTLAALADVVLEPIGRELRTPRVAIVLDGILEYVPVGALPSPRSLAALDRKAETRPATADADANQPYRPLILDREVVYLPSASTLEQLRSSRPRRPSADASVAIFADPVFASDDPRVVKRRPVDSRVPPPPRLASTRKEGEAIAGIAGITARVALDFHASRTAVMDRDVGRFRVVHFATHAVIDDRHPELAGIMLSRVTADGAPQDGLLRLHDVYDLKWSADLVVLSACRTAIGPEIRGEGLVGFVDGFMSAGARRVVASLWTVDDAATAELMRAFYTAFLRDGLDAAAALRHAQQHVRQQPRWRAPFYWAAFVLQGDWH